MESWLTSILNLFKRLGWVGTLGLSLLLLASSILLVGFLVVRWPVEQFKGPAALPFWAHRHPVIRIAGLIAKNVAGYLIVLLGMLMAIPGVPGQGTLLILAGLTLIDFPGKRRLERKLIARPRVLRLVNRLRMRFGQGALEID
jgi:hypothetical protein